jgi:sugar/nucleoside kinase (ribokinase family)
VNEAPDMSISVGFIGHLSVDHNVVGGRRSVLYGGGVLHGSITAKRLGADSCLYTKCAAEDRPSFSVLDEAGVLVTVMSSPTSTSIRNEYGDDPDDRVSTLRSRAAPFEAADVERISPCDVLVINPLWFGEFPCELIAAAKAKAEALAGDAQGFLRRPGPTGELSHRDWQDKQRYLPAFDFFKVDGAEARMLTGEVDPARAARALHDLGARVVVLTHKAGLCAFDGSALHESRFDAYPLMGRTGRGDTCMAAFLVAQAELGIAEAVAQAADVASRKMQYPGPFRG